MVCCGIVVAVIAFVFFFLPMLKYEYIWDRDFAFLLINTRRGWVLAGRPDQYDPAQYVSPVETDSRRILKDTNVYHYRGNAVPALFRVETTGQKPRVYVISREGEVFRVNEDGRLRFKRRDRRN